MKRILVLEFITSFGGVQSVYKNILPILARNNKVFFLNPYSESDDLELRQSNIEVVNLPIQSDKALGWKNGLLSKCKIVFKYGIRYLLFCRKLIKFVMDNKIDLLYVSGKKEFFFALILKKVCKIEYIYHAHGFGRKEDINWLTRLAITKAKCVICVSNDVKNKILQRGIPDDNIYVVNNGLNLMSADRKIKAASKSIMTNGAFTVAFAGTVQPQKGVATLINAVMKLSEVGYNIRLIIIGNCNNNDYLELLKKISSSDVVSFCGFSSNVYDYFLNTDVVVLPSREESFGMVLLEAMYARKPVIGSDIGGIPDIIVDGENGFLFKCDDDIALSKLLLNLYKDKHLCKMLGENGYLRVCQVFDSENQAQKINTLINK